MPTPKGPPGDGETPPELTVANFEEIMGVPLPELTIHVEDFWEVTFRGHMVVLSAIDESRNRHWLAVLGRSEPILEEERSSATPTSFGELIDLVSYLPGFPPIEADPDLTQPGYHLELHDGLESAVFVGDRPTDLVKNVLRGLRGARPDWQVLRIYPQARSRSESDRIGLQRSTMGSVFEALASINDLGRFALDKDGLLVDNVELSITAASFLEGGAWTELQDGTSVAVGAHRLTPNDLERKERSEGEKNGVERSTPPPTSEEVIHALTDRVGEIADPLARLVLLDQLSRELMPAVYEQMMEAAAQHRAPVEEGGQGGTWVDIAKLFGVSAQAVQQRLDPGARERKAEDARKRRAEDKPRG